MESDPGIGLGTSPQRFSKETWSISEASLSAALNGRIGVHIIGTKLTGRAVLDDLYPNVLLDLEFLWQNGLEEMANMPEPSPRLPIH